MAGDHGSFKIDQPDKVLEPRHSVCLPSIRSVCLTPIRDSPALPITCTPACLACCGHFSPLLEVPARIWFRVSGVGFRV